MIPALLPALALLVATATSLAPRAAVTPAAAGQASELAEALSAFRRASNGTLDERRIALDRLVELANAGALPDLQAEFARVSTGLRETRDQLYRDRYTLDHQRRTYERLKLSVERDPSLQDVLTRQGRRVDELADKVERASRRLAELNGWYGVLAEGSGRFFERIPASRRKSAEKDLWKEVEASSDDSLRLAAIDLLGHAGGVGTAVAMEGLITKYTRERAKLSRELPKELVELRKLEQRWQREADQNDGRTSRGAQEQYDRARQKALALQKSVTMLGYLADSAAQAGGLALARETDKELERAVQRLLRIQSKAGDGARRRILELLATSRLEPALAGLRAMLVTKEEPGGRAAAIAALAIVGDQEIVPTLLESSLLDPDWIVRSSAAFALARLRVKAAIPVLIERLGQEEGRLRTDVREALVSLTGRDFHSNTELWRRFWSEQGEGFVVPEIEDPGLQASEEAREAVGLTFFGIQTESRRVLFVLDLSRSMTWAMVPRRRPNDEDPADPDMPQGDELSRLAAAKQALVRALGGIEDGAVFNLVFYATDVWTWQDQLVTMTADLRSAAMRYVEALDANGGTNIYGALSMALDMAGARGGDAWSKPAIDTIYFLSDGRASVGVTTDADEILAFVRERNSSAGIVIHSIGLSGAQDAYLMRSLAEQNGGTYVSR